MANQSYNNNNSTQRTEASTRGFHTSNAGAVKPTAIDWSYQGEMMRITLTDQLPENEQTEKRRYDYDHSWITCLTRIKCLDLYTQFKNIILPTIMAPASEKVDKFVSVTVGNVNQFGIGALSDENGNIRCYVKLIRNINPDDLKSNEEISYEFKKGEVIVNYNNETGKFGNRIQDQTELYLFLRDMDNFVDASSKAYTHSNRLVEKTYKDMVLSDIRAVGNKVGAEVSVPYAAQRAGARYGQQSLFDSTAMTAPTETITSLDDLDIPAE